jgi:PhnB protein
MADDATTHTPPSVACSIAPMLSVRQGARAVEFYKSAFGAIEVFRVDAPDGTVVSRLAVHGAEFWVADESPAHKNFSPESLGGGTVRLILTVPDPDRMFARAVAAGATQVVAMEDNYGWRLGRVVDPYGHHWEIGRPLEDAR